MSTNLGSRYVLDKILGRGGFGEVWSGHDSDGNRLAFKVLHASFSKDARVVARFVQERSILISLDHPNLVKVRDMVMEGETLALVMDLVEGGDLRGLLQNRHALPMGDFYSVATGLTDALTAIHANGIVHRDVKPANILIDADPAGRILPLLTDFGISRIAASSGDSTEFTGTPTYVAPELFDDGPVTPAVDLYSLGILLYELISGAPPFQSDSMLSLMRMHAQDTPSRPSDVSDELWDLISALLSKIAGDRPDSASVARQLSSLASSTTVSDATQTPLYDHHGARPIEIEPLDDITVVRIGARPPIGSEPELVEVNRVEGAPPAVWETKPKGGKRTRLRWVLLGMGGFAMLVAASIIAALHLLGGGGTPGTSNVADSSITRCWDGKTTDARAVCAALSGKDALLWYAGIDPNDVDWAPQDTGKPISCRYPYKLGKDVWQQADEAVTCGWNAPSKIEGAAIVVARWKSQAEARDQLERSLKAARFSVDDFEDIDGASEGTLLNRVPGPVINPPDNLIGKTERLTVKLYNEAPVAVAIFAFADDDETAKERLEDADGRIHLPTLEEIKRALASTTKD